MTDKKLLKAIECCRDDDCYHCPFLFEMCNKLNVEMTDIPVELLDKIGMQLCEKSDRSISHAETTI